MKMMENRNLVKVFTKGKIFKYHCQNCLSKKFVVTQKRKNSVNEDGSICYAIGCKCKECKATDTFFINFYEEGSISENLISF